MNLRQFSRRMKFRAENLVQETNRIVKQVALVVDQTVVLATPVDTGRARANWLVSVDGPNNSEVDAVDPTGSSALAQGRSVISGRTPGQSVYVTNNVDYIGFLNAGSSAQAPAGFVEEAVQAGVVFAAQAQIDTGKKK